MKLFKESDSNKKIVVTDFGRIKPAELVPHYNMTRREIRESMLLVTPNGRLLLNKNMPGIDAVKIALERIQPQAKSTLEELENIYKAKYPMIEDVKDLPKLSNNGERFEALVMLLIPAELGRRGIEEFYYDS